MEETTFVKTASDSTRYTIHMTDRDCNTCGLTFSPSSRHLTCPKCRSQKTKPTCPECGGLRNKRSRCCRPCSIRLKSNTGNWKGGVTVHKSGYVLRLSRDHPRAVGSRYVFDHILVMESHLGRYLLPKETVHHKNGIRDDNRIENLELWSGNHPSGARVEDLTEWAISHLREYKPEALST